MLDPPNIIQFSAECSAPRDASVGLRWLYRYVQVGTVCENWFAMIVLYVIVLLLVVCDAGAKTDTHGAPDGKVTRRGLCLQGGGSKV